MARELRTSEEKGYCADYDDSGYASVSDSGAGASVSTGRFLDSDVRTPSVDPEMSYSPRMVEAAKILTSFRTGVAF